MNAVQLQPMAVTPPPNQNPLLPGQTVKVRVLTPSQQHGGVPTHPEPSPSTPPAPLQTFPVVDGSNVINVPYGPGVFGTTVRPTPPENLSVQPPPTHFYTNLPLNPTQPVANPAMYPKSTDLYNNLVRAYGEINIRPPPDWLTNDNLRKQWLKTNENAFLYFQYRKEKYLQKYKEYVDYGCCAPCCVSLPGEKYANQVTGCKTCFAEFICCCACNSFCSGTRNYKMVFPDKKEPNCCDSFFNCCPCSLAYKTRRAMITRTNSMGVEYNESSCLTCIKLCLCSPCYLGQTTQMIQYLFQKRYGVLVANKKDHERRAEREFQENQLWEVYQNDLRLSPLHPNGNSVTWLKNSKSASFNTRELVDQTRRGIVAPLVGVGVDYTDPAWAAYVHNNRWKRVHRIYSYPGLTM